MAYDYRKSINKAYRNTTEDYRKIILRSFVN